jgi:hypothetical protein
VHAQHRRPRLLLALGEARRAADTRDVDHRVEPTELVDEPREQRVDGRRVGDRRASPRRRRPRRCGRRSFRGASSCPGRRPSLPGRR